MAVLRAAQLWIGPVPPNTDLQRPEVSPALENLRSGSARSVHLYTCPSGYKAIVRTMTFTLDVMQTGQGPTMALWLRPTGQSVEWKVYWFWFQADSTSQQLSYRFHTTWNGQLVLKPGDTLTAAHSAVGNMHTFGAGHELPI